MERNVDTPNTEPNARTTASAMSGEVELAGAAPLEGSGRDRGRLASSWRFTRHLLEMVVAMMLGMGVFGLVIGVLGEPPGYANLLVRYGLMGAFMAAPMVAWMRFRRHPWRDGSEMTGAMVVPMLALALPVEFGVEVPGLTEDSLMMLSHVAMIAGMVALMLYRFDRYAHAPHERRARERRRVSSG